MLTCLSPGPPELRLGKLQDPLRSCQTNSVGSPIIGGSLSRPADRYPNVFGHIEFLKQYPYFLACAIPATFSAIACFITLFFLKEVRRSLPSSPRSGNEALMNTVDCEEPSVS